MFKSRLLVCFLFVPLFVYVKGDSDANKYAPDVTINNVFSYCTIQGNMDSIDVQKIKPDWLKRVEPLLRKTFSLSSSIPVGLVVKGTFWRCMEGQVYVCIVGANIPCWGKADVSRKPTVAMQNFCHFHSGSTDLPITVTGSATVFSWQCKNSVPVIIKQEFQIDSRGFQKKWWYKLSLPSS